MEKVILKQLYHFFANSQLTWESAIATTTEATRLFGERVNSFTARLVGTIENPKLLFISAADEQDCLLTSTLRNAEVNANGYAVVKTANSSFHLWNETMAQHNAELEQARKEFQGSFPLVYPSKPELEGLNNLRADCKTSRKGWGDDFARQMERLGFHRGYFRLANDKRTGGKRSDYGFVDDIFVHQSILPNGEQLSRWEGLCVYVKYDTDDQGRYKASKMAEFYIDSIEEAFGDFLNTAEENLFRVKADRLQGDIDYQYEQAVRSWEQEKGAWEALGFYCTNLSKEYLGGYRGGSRKEYTFDRPITKEQFLSYCSHLGICTEAREPAGPYTPEEIEIYQKNLSSLGESQTWVFVYRPEYTD